MVQIGKVISEKIWFDFLYVHDLWPRARNDLDLQYSHTFINLIRCLLLPTFRSLAAIVSEKNTIFTFSYGKAQITKFDLAVKLVKVTPGSSFEQTMMGRSPQYYIPSFVEIGLLVPEKKFLKVFYQNGHDGHLGHVTSIMLTNFHFLVAESFHTKLVQNGTVVSEKIWFEFL